MTIAVGPELREELRVSSALVARLSGQLVSGSMASVFSMTGESMTGERSAGAEARKIRRIVSLLVSVPVWLIIVLLSPLDAYAAARLITDARWQQERV
jgi:ABC-type glycerol-3-phosphate transport system permease component